MAIAATCIMTFPTATLAQKYVGGDISNLTNNEKKSPTYLDASGNEVADPLDLFKSEQLNAMRVRLILPTIPTTTLTYARIWNTLKRLAKE